MCSGLEMVNGKGSQDGSCTNFSILLEMSALDNLIGFKQAVEEKGHDIDETGLWYGRRIGTKTMGFVERTPLMIAALFGSNHVLSYLIETGLVDINKASVSDGSTALHCAASGGSDSAADIIRTLLDASADTNSLDFNGNRPADLISSVSRKKSLEIVLKGGDSGEEYEDLSDEIFYKIEKKEYPIDLTLPDIKNGIYGTDDFRMYCFKVKPCSRAYSHDWTECPFVHPGENARRRDPRKYHYSCVPCPEFRKGTCMQGDACEYAHGIFECWLHPAQYRTRLCKDEIKCTRRVCFFAHKPEELRPLYASTGSAVPPTVGNMWSNISSPTLQLSTTKLKSGLNAKDMDFEVESFGLENRRRRQQHHKTILNRFGVVKPTNIEDVYGFLDPTISQQQHMRQDMNQQLQFTEFAKRGQSIIERRAVNNHNGMSSPRSPASALNSNLSGWGSPNGMLNWGLEGEELNRLRKSASFGFRSGTHHGASFDEPDVSWVQSLVKETSSIQQVGHLCFDDKHQRYHAKNLGSEMQMVA